MSDTMLLHLRPGRNEGSPAAIEQALSALRTRQFSLLLAKVEATVRHFVEAPYDDIQAIESVLYSQLPNTQIEAVDANILKAEDGHAVATT